MSNDITWNLTANLEGIQSDIANLRISIQQALSLLNRAMGLARRMGLPEDMMAQIEQIGRLSRAILQLNAVYTALMVAAAPATGGLSLLGAVVGAGAGAGMLAMDLVDEFGGYNRT